MDLVTVAGHFDRSTSRSRCSEPWSFVPRYQGHTARIEWQRKSRRFVPQSFHTHNQGLVKVSSGTSFGLGEPGVSFQLLSVVIGKLTRRQQASILTCSPCFSRDLPWPAFLVAIGQDEAVIKRCKLFADRNQLSSPMMNRTLEAAATAACAEGNMQVRKQSFCRHVTRF